MLLIGRLNFYYIMKDLRIRSIKRKKQLEIKVNGEVVISFRGETVLAALIAAGYKTLRKSSVIGENRGALCGMGVCYDCLVTVNGIPDIRACMIEVEENMEVLLND